MRLLRPLLTIALLLVPAALSAQVRPQPGEGDPHLQSVEYHPDQVVRIEAVPGYQVTLEFAADEQIENVAVGDSGAWQVAPNHRGDHLFIKLLQPGIATNMTVLTSTRVYVFELAPLLGDPSTMAYTVHFTYPHEGTDNGDETAATAEGRYRLSGERALRPTGISDDGQHTYVEWPESQALPAVYAIDDAGREELVNGMMRGNLYVIDSVHNQLVFRIDRHSARARRVEPR